MRKFLIVLAAAATLAALLAASWRPVPVEERRVRIEAQRAFPELAARADLAARVPVEVQAQLLDYADDELLLLKARAAVLARPDMAARILPLYGATPEFRAILRAHGEAVLPPIAHFLDNEVVTLTLADAAARAVEKVRGVKGVAGTERPALTPEDRGWHAVRFIQAEGHDFLGQFEVAPDGGTHWIRTERVLEGLGSLFAGGVRDLERKYRTGREVTAGDLGWAAVDAVAVLGAVQILRAGKAAAAAVRTGEAGARASATAARLARAGKIGLAGASRAKWPAALVATWIAVRHPGVVSEFFAGLAAMAGVPAWLAVFGGWTLLLLPIMFLALPVLRLATGLLLALLGLLRGALARIERGPYRRT